jgi:Pilus formation protein N terminal region
MEDTMRQPYEPYKRRLFRKPARRRAGRAGIMLALAAALVGLVIAGAWAAEPGRALRVEVDKAEVVPLGGTASVVLIANPQVADVVVEKNHLVFVLGKRPGETRLFVYDGAGHALVSRDIVVVPPDQRTVTITRDTLATTYSCDPRCASMTPAGARPGTPGAPGAAPAAPVPAAAPPATTASAY